MAVKKKQIETQSHQLTYSSYLQVEKLLQLQKPLSEPVAHDEMLFIIIHQVYELWFKQVLFELDAVVIHLNRSEYLPSFHRLERVCEILRLLVNQVDILETMTPVEFNKFRGKLNPASGFQSLQFRELEILGGLSAQDYSQFAKLNPEWAGKLKERLAKPTLRDAFFKVLQTKAGKKLEDKTRLQEALLKVYLEKNLDSTMRTLCEFLIRVDELVQLWRFRHVQMVERMIGMKMGTGGSLGATYLKTTLTKRFFPELWELRTELPH